MKTIKSTKPYICPSLAAIFKPHRLPLAILLAMTGIQGVQAAEDEALEEIMVTGSRIRTTSALSNGSM